MFITQESKILDELGVTACPLISARVLIYVADEIVEAQDFFWSLFGFSVRWTSAL